MAKKRGESYSIANIGVFDGEAPVSESATEGNQHWRVPKTVFSQSSHISGSVVRFCIVSTEGGETVIALSWQEGVVPADDIDRVAQTRRESSCCD